MENKWTLLVEFISLRKFTPVEYNAEVFPNIGPLYLVIIKKYIQKGLFKKI